MDAVEGKHLVLSLIFVKYIPMPGVNYPEA